jgi:hypothetical protein
MYCFWTWSHIFFPFTVGGQVVYIMYHCFMPFSSHSFPPRRILSCIDMFLLTLTIRCGKIAIAPTTILWECLAVAY